MTMENHIVLIVNICASLLAIAASFFPLYWAKSHNSDYKDGLRLLLPGLAQASVGSLLFGVLYALRILDAIDDAGLRTAIRPLTLVFLLVPFTMVVSLHYWKR